MAITCYDFVVGKELLNDALLLQEAGFTPDQCVVNVMGVSVRNTYSSPDPELLAAQEAALPALLLAREVRLCSVAHNARSYLSCFTVQPLSSSH